LNTGLVYFGKRYYDPIFRRWLTTDPLGPENHSNLYQYLFNSPYLYEDPSGEFAFAIPLLIWGAELMLPTLSACITAATYTAAASVIAYAGYKGIEAINNRCYVDMGDHYLQNGSYTVSKNDPGSPTSNKDQNKQAEDAKKEIERQLGRKLNSREERKFHDHVTGQGYGYHELVEEGYWLLGGL